MAIDAALAEGVPAPSDPLLAAFVAAGAVLADRRGLPPDPEAERRELADPPAGWQALLLASRDGRPVARLVARLSTLRDRHGACGIVGLVAAAPGDAGRAGLAALLDLAVRRLRAAGATTVLGPVDRDTWHRYRCCAGPFAERPFLGEPWDPPHLAGFFADAGWAVAERYVSKAIADPVAVRDALAAGRRDAEAAGYRLRPLDLARFDDELRVLHRLSSAIFARNAFFTPLDEARFLALYRPLRPLVDPALARFAVAPSGEEVGLFFAYPDRLPLLRALKRGGWLAGWRALPHLRRPSTVLFKTIGVVPDHRRSGVAAALVHAGYEAALAAGYRRVVHCLLRADNPSHALDAGRGVVCREYLLFSAPEVAA